MHELYLMQSMISRVNSSAVEHGISHVSSIHIVIGELSGVDTQALRSVFAFFRSQPLLQDAMLEIEERELIGRCNSCQREFKIDEYRFVCSFCQGSDIELIHGRELFIDYFEGD